MNPGLGEGFQIFWVGSNFVGRVSTLLCRVRVPTLLVGFQLLGGVPTLLDRVPTLGEEFQLYWIGSNFGYGFQLWVGFHRLGEVSTFLGSNLVHSNFQQRFQLLVEVPMNSNLCGGQGQSFNFLEVSTFFFFFFFNFLIFFNYFMYLQFFWWFNLGFKIFFFYF